jgi:outer membrane protein assembly factor BamD (BamD/ComL family)
MRQNIVLLLLAAALLAGGTACKKKQSTAEKQAAVVNAFRQKQKIEAIKSYTALVEKYPDSEFAAKAKERLAVLGPLPAATPAAKKQ